MEKVFEYLFSGYFIIYVYYLRPLNNIRIQPKICLMSRKSNSKCCKTLPEVAKPPMLVHNLDLPSKFLHALVVN